MEIALVVQPGKIMKIPNLTIQQLLEAGVHLGHKTLRWNPKMKKYIFGKRESIHIIDLTQTLELIKIALEKVHDIISNNGKILEKSYKRQFKLLQEGLEAIREIILSSNQSYFASIYKKTDKPIRYIEAQNEFFVSSPRFILESVSLFLIAVIAYLLTTSKMDSTEIISILGTFAIGSQRLLPAMQGAYNEWARLKTFLPAVKSITPLSVSIPKIF